MTDLDDFERFATVESFKEAAAGDGEGWPLMD